MNVYLFRKITFEGKDYYQLFDSVDNFNNDKKIVDYDNRNSKDVFYVEKNGKIEIPNESINSIYYIENNKFVNVDDVVLLDKLSRAFDDKYQFFDIVNSVKEKVSYQDYAINSLVKQLLENQEVIKSDLPKEVKRILNKNIVFHGLKGSGKKTIVESIAEKIDAPCVIGALSSDMQSNLRGIITELYSKAKKPEDVNHGIIFIKDNYDELMEILQDRFYPCLSLLTQLKKTAFEGKMVDFETLTFVFLVDSYGYEKTDLIKDIGSYTNCKYVVETSDLSIKEKYNILFGHNGRLHHYKKFFEKHGKQLIIDNESLYKIITQCASVNPSMGFLNSTLDAVITEMNADNVKTIYIDDAACEDVKELLDPIIMTIAKKYQLPEEYWFEKRVDEIVEKAKQFIVGQDKILRKYVYELLNNIRMANDDTLENPKDAINNILIRGNTGTGKTYLSSVVLPYLGVPYFIADATKYTEEGYVGDSVSDMLVGLVHAAGGDIEKAQRGILVIDEIDKKAANAIVGGHDVSRGAVQEALYKIAEGSKIRINIGTRLNEQWVYFDTSRLTVVCSGAFEGIENYRDDRIGKRKIGLDREEVKKGEDPNIIDQDYISYGMKAQFMRRVKTIFQLDDISKNQLINIMKTSKSSALLMEKYRLNTQGIDIEYKDDFLDALADKAIEMKQGISGIGKALNKVLDSIDIQDVRASKTEKIILGGEVINDPAKVEFVERAKQYVMRNR